LTGPIRVLIADEHAGTRAEMREAVEQDGRFTVVAEATDGAAAVQAALSERPDLCLVDIRMLGSGIAATREITARLPETKVVMITASLDENRLPAHGHRSGPPPARPARRGRGGRADLAPARHPPGRRVP
jgi:CheY-like chemotaxis protein